MCFTPPVHLVKEANVKTRCLRQIVNHLFLPLLISLPLLFAGCAAEKTSSFDGIDLSDLESSASAAVTPSEKETPSAVPEETTASTKPGEKQLLDLEKDTLKFGFIKLTDCAPIVIAKEKGFFEDEGLQVDVEAQPNWKTLLDRVINGELDGSHMLSGQPIAATIGFGTKAHIITAFTMDLNGNGITVSNSHLGADAGERLGELKEPHAVASDLR